MTLSLAVQQNLEETVQQQSAAVKSASSEIATMEHDQQVLETRSAKSAAMVTTFQDSLQEMSKQLVVRPMVFFTANFGSVTG